MNVRNFWIESRVDGRQTKAETEPAASDGGFDTTIYIREEGNIRKAVSITGRVTANGRLRIDVQPADGSTKGFHVETER